MHLAIYIQTIYRRLSYNRDILEGGVHLNHRHMYLCKAQLPG
jgi:hypothetical protein